MSNIEDLQKRIDMLERALCLCAFAHFGSAPRPVPRGAITLFALAFEP